MLFSCSFESVATLCAEQYEAEFTPKSSMPFHNITQRAQPTKTPHQVVDRSKKLSTSALMLGSCILLVLFRTILSAQGRLNTIIDAEESRKEKSHFFNPEQNPRQRASCKKMRHLNCSKEMYNVGSVIYLNNGRSAGLRDVRSVVQSIANMAAPLCASIHLRPPSEMLKYEVHNNGIPLSEDLPWSDYFNLTRRQDGADMISDLPENNAHVTRVILKASNGKIAMQQYKKIVAMARKGEQFIWEIRSNIYQWRDEFAQLSQQQGYIFPFPRIATGGCMHTTMRGSDLQFEAMAQFFQRINTTTFNAFHIRRGDDVEGCDSSIGFLHKYLQCSFADCATKQAPVVLFTNEGDSQYIDQVRDLVNQYSYKMFHGDILLQEAIDSLRQGSRKNVVDNFFLFGVADMIMRRASAKLSRHRLRCKDCDPVCSS